MRKAVMLTMAVALMLGFTGRLLAQDRPGGPDPAKMKELAEVRTKIMQIERKASADDPELKDIMQQMQDIQKKRQERLDAVLKDNADYQELKKKLAELQPPRPERPDRPAPERRGDAK